MPDVFISYSRRNLEFVQQLVTALTARGKDSWFDQLKEPLAGIAAGAPWWKQIQDGIEGVDNFLFVISPDSIKSPYCHAEIHYAREHGKRLVPLLYCGWIGEGETRTAIDAAIEAIPDTEEMPDSVTSSILNLKKLVRQNWLAISEVQYVTFSSSLSFDQSLQQLVQALDLDLAWMKMHSQLVQATKLWEANDFHDDYLWGAIRLKPVHEMMERRKPELAPLVREFIKPEQERLLAEINNINTSHQRRSAIGDRLGIIGDTRQGVGVKNRIPDILWLPVRYGGQIKIKYNIFNIQPFYIAKYCVTYIQYQAFVDADDGFNNLRWWKEMPNKYQRQGLDNQHTKSTNNPRDNISWYQSVAFSRWLDAKAREADLLPDDKLVVRLPTEWEWQWAAQAGKEERKYPWGQWEDGYADTAEAGVSRAVPVGMYPQGAAACGALDMVGNLWEWCLNDSEKVTQLSSNTGKEKTQRGGSFRSNRDEASIFCRSYDNLSSGYLYAGFRVVLAPPVQF